MTEPERTLAADTMREQAAELRRLAKGARTSAGGSALAGMARMYDDDARRLDPGSEQR